MDLGGSNQIRNDKSSRPWLLIEGGAGNSGEELKGKGQGAAAKSWSERKVGKSRGKMHPQSYASNWHVSVKERTRPRGKKGGSREERPGHDVATTNYNSLKRRTAMSVTAARGLVEGCGRKE